MTEILTYIKPELLALIPVLFFVGIAMKRSESVKDKFIPAALGLVGVLLAILYVLATSPIAGWQDALMAIFVALTQGVLCAGCSVYADQTIKQAKKEE